MVLHFDTESADVFGTEKGYFLRILFRDSESNGVLEQIQLCCQDCNFGHMS